MVCSKCGSEMPDYAKKCRICGTEKQAEPQRKLKRDPVHGCLFAIGIIAAFVGSIICACLILTSPLVGGDGGTVMQAWGLAVFFVAGTVVAIQRKMRTMRWILPVSAVL